MCWFRRNSSNLDRAPKTSRNQFSQLIFKVILRNLPLSTFISPIYTFSLAGNIIVYTPSKGKK